MHTLVWIHFKINPIQPWQKVRVLFCVVPLSFISIHRGNLNLSSTSKWFVCFLLLRRLQTMVACTKSTKNRNKYEKCYGSSWFSSQTHDWYHSCSCCFRCESPWLSFSFSAWSTYSASTAATAAAGATAPAMMPAGRACPA